MSRSTLTLVVVLTLAVWTSALSSAAASAAAPAVAVAHAGRLAALIPMRPADNTGLSRFPPGPAAATPARPLSHATAGVFGRVAACPRPAASFPSYWAAQHLLI